MKFHYLWKCEISLTFFLLVVLLQINIFNKFLIADTKLYAPVLRLSTQDNAKLLKQLGSSVKRTIHWNKYQSKITGTKPIFRLFNWSTFSGFKWAFALLFKDKNVRESYKQYFLPTVRKKRLKYYFWFFLFKILLFNYILFFILKNVLQ